MAAVEVKAGYKYYGNSVDPNKKIVLNYLNMNVLNGSMYVLCGFSSANCASSTCWSCLLLLFGFYSRYGLLGASGCGKTTLLSCIVGQKKLHEGQINVLGTDITKNSGVIGPRIGFMPQVN